MRRICSGRRCWRASTTGQKNHLKICTKRSLSAPCKNKWHWPKQITSNSYSGTSMGCTRLLGVLTCCTNSHVTNGKASLIPTNFPFRKCMKLRRSGYPDGLPSPQSSSSNWDSFLKSSPVAYSTSIRVEGSTSTVKCLLERS